jgi:PBP1b-binding outer membrane lipoprotein LpoB
MKMKQIMMLLAAMLLTACSKNSEVKAQTMTQKMYITIDGQTQPVTLVDNAATQELISKLQQGAVNVTLNSSVRSDKESGAYYSLNGQRVENPRKGLFIKNGKKIVL